MRYGRCLVRLILDGGCTGGHCRGGHVERTADAIEHVGDLWRAVGPTEACAGEPVDLGKRAGHHGVVRCRNELDARLVVVVPHVLGVGRVEHQQNVVRQLGAQGPHLVDRDISARRVVRIGYKHYARLWRHAR